MKKQLRAIVSAIALVAVPALAGAQSLAYNSGQNVAHGYEGWEEEADGTKYFLFGYMNRNWEEEPDVPVGPENGFSPGPADQGQPTHFLPRRNRFVFRVKVPATFSVKDELVWTLTTNGKTEKAYASLREDYKVDDVVKASTIDVDTEGSVVTLTGGVESADEERRAVRIATETAGVTKVVNHLNVRGSRVASDADSR